MGKHSRGAKSNKSLERNRYEIAQEAARIIATQGQRSYRLAKEKAAERLGISQRQALPSNVEIEEALKTWQRLYGGEAQALHLDTLRRLALEAMDFFKDFRPRLVGPVLEGTADQFSRICLHLFTDDPDAPMHHLMHHRIPFQQETRRIRWHRGQERVVDVLVLDHDGQLIECTLMVGPDAKGAPPSPIDGQPMARASTRELSELLAAADPSAD